MVPAFDWEQAVRIRIGKAAMQREGTAISLQEIDELVPQLQPTKTLKGVTLAKSDPSLVAAASRAVFSVVHSRVNPTEILAKCTAR